DKSDPPTIKPARGEQAAKQQKNARPYQDQMLPPAERRQQGAKRAETRPFRGEDRQATRAFIREAGFPRVSQTKDSQDYVQNQVSAVARKIAELQEPGMID